MLQVVNILKGAITTASAIITVSESYAWEITQAAHGVGLHSIMRANAHRLTGIVNGIDHTTWDPATDTHLPRTFSAADLSGKAVCKAELRRELRLPEPDYDVAVPLVGFVGRLDPQKGLDLILDALPGLLSLDCQVCFFTNVVPAHGHLLCNTLLTCCCNVHLMFWQLVVQCCKLHMAMRGAN